MTEEVAVQFDWDKITGPLGETEDIFKDEIDRIEKLCGECDFEKNSSNVISIVGNRGCGKTSLIKAVRKHFDGKAGFHVTDTIDPSIFDDTLLIPEFFISVLAEEVENLKKKDDSPCEKKYEFAGFQKKLNEIMEVISHIKSNKERFYEDNHPLDIVRTIQKRYRFDELLKELIDSFFRAIGKETATKMVVCIDDLDLVSNKYVYQMIEDIQKWLNKNCIVILSFREVQLLNIIQDQFIKQNINLINNGIISISEIRDQTIQFYEKQMPVSRRIYLKGQKEFFNETAWDILKPFVTKIPDEKQRSYEKKNFHDFMEKLVREKVALPLDPVDEKERVHLIYPNGLREMLAFIRMLYEMPKMRDEDGNVAKENLQQNLKNYQNYILSRAKANLDAEYYAILDEWIKTSVGNKNYYICSKLDKFLKESVSKSSKNKGNDALKNLDGYHDGTLIYIESTQPYNVMLGDVIQFIERIKVFFSYSEQMMYMCYLIKLLYSIELLTSFLKLKTTDLSSKTEAPLDDEDENDEEDVYESRKGDEYCLPNTPYSKLINCKFMPDDYLYAPKNINAVSFIDIEYKYKNDDLKRIVEKIAYSRRKVGSKIWAEARPTSPEKKGFGRFKPLYHDVIFIEKEDRSEWNYKERVYYKADPLSAVLKRDYLSAADENKQYIFYSLFDVDVFMRLTFYNKESETLRFLYNKINWVLDGDEEGEYSQYEQSLKSAISHLYKIKTNKIFADETNKIFPDELISEISLFDKFKKELPSEIISLMKKIYKADIHSWRDWAEKIKNISTLSGDDKQRAQKMSDGLNTKNRRALWSEEESDFKYFLQKYPEVRALFK